MGRDKPEAPSTREAKALAAKAAAAPPAVEPPKRKLHKIHSNVSVAKPAKEVVLGGGGGPAGARGECGKGGGRGGGAAGAASETSGRSAAAGSDLGRASGGGCDRAPAEGSSVSARISGSELSSEASEVRILLKDWQRLPQQLLQELCDKTVIFAKQKAPKPDYQPYKCLLRISSRLLHIWILRTRTPSGAHLSCFSLVMGQLP